MVVIQYDIDILDLDAAHPRGSRPNLTKSLVYGGLLVRYNKIYLTR